MAPPLTDRRGADRWLTGASIHHRDRDGVRLRGSGGGPAPGYTGHERPGIWHPLRGPVRLCLAPGTVPSRRAAWGCGPGRGLDATAGLFLAQNAALRAGRQDDGHRRYGRIGRRVGELAQAFGMHILACDPAAQPATTAAAADPVAWCDLDTLFARSDVISLHCPLTEQTAGLVNRQRLRCG